jgi:hypothetical protein
MINSKCDVLMLFGYHNEHLLLATAVVGNTGKSVSGLAAEGSQSV